MELGFRLSHLAPDRELPLKTQIVPSNVLGRCELIPPEPEAEAVFGGSVMPQPEVVVVKGGDDLPWHCFAAPVARQH